MDEKLFGNFKNKIKKNHVIKIDIIENEDTVDFYKRVLQKTKKFRI